MVITRVKCWIKHKEKYVRPLHWIRHGCPDGSLSTRPGGVQSTTIACLSYCNCLPPAAGTFPSLLHRDWLKAIFLALAKAESGRSYLSQLWPKPKVAKTELFKCNQLTALPFKGLMCNLWHHNLQYCSTQPSCWIQISTIDVINVAADHHMFMTLTGELSWQRLRRTVVDFYSKKRKTAFWATVILAKWLKPR